MTGASKIPCLYKGLSALKNLKTHTMLQKPSAPTQIHRLSVVTAVKNHSFCRSLLHLMSSAKLQVRPILLKKISFMIFFNNYLSDYEIIRCHRKEKINKRFFLF